jgi:hypothetical protein
MVEKKTVDTTQDPATTEPNVLDMLDQDAME